MNIRLEVINSLFFFFIQSVYSQGNTTYIVVLLADNVRKK